MNECKNKDAAACLICEQACYGRPRERDAKRVLKEYIAATPDNFGLHAHRGRRFRISVDRSYVGDHPGYVPQIVVQINAPERATQYNNIDGDWLDFARCTIDELNAALAIIKEES